jgi:ferrochelatase
MMQGREETAVILLAYGGPDSLDDIPAYLLDIRGGRHTPQPLIDEITERYRLIGGRSPLLEITQSVAQKLENRLDLPVFIGMRHWHPFIGDIVEEISASGVKSLVAICMAPHFSMLSIGKYKEKLDEAITVSGVNIERRFVENWYDQPDYLKGIAENVEQTLSRWPAAEQEQVKIVFTAHSLPEFILDRGDPYDEQLRQTASLLAERLELPADRWTFSYQSAALTGVPWLGPQIEDLVVDLAQAGEKDLLIAPIGFIADHVEVLYDIDIGVQQIAQAHRVHIERPPMLNDSEALIDALAAIAKDILEPSVT